jgi:hypothetical protein
MYMNMSGFIPEYFHSKGYRIFLFRLGVGCVRWCRERLKYENVLLKCVGSDKQTASKTKLLNRNTKIHKYIQSDS